MSRLQFSQLNILWQSCMILVLSCLILKIIDGQIDNPDWPVIIDPFPDPDIIGPEPVPTPAPTPDCTLACQDRIAEATSLAARLQQQLYDTNTTLLNRIISLEANGGGGGSDPLLAQRVFNLETYLPANVSTLNSKIDTDIDALRNQLRAEIALLRQDLETKINSIPSGGGGGGGSDAKTMEVYLNLTQRINNLENGKIQNLVTDNNLWRQNFKIVNSTFAKLKKSAFSNNVVLNG